jgi:hypothetical protein
MSHTEAGTFTFTAGEVWLLHYAVRDLIVRCKLGNRSLPDGFDRLHVKLVSSVDGTKSCAPQPQCPPSTEELIDSTEAAAILERSDRWVRDPRFRENIGGRDIGGRWLYPRQTVVEYAERKAGRHN